jgi:hypothetical protein
MSKSKLETRIAALEAEVAQLKQDVQARGGNGSPWWEKIAGTLPNDDLTRRAEAAGRKYRASVKSKPKKGKGKLARSRHRSRQPAATR